MGNLIDCLKRTRLPDAYQQLLIKEELAGEDATILTEELLANAQADLEYSLKQLGIEQPKAAKAETAERAASPAPKRTEPKVSLGKQIDENTQEVNEPKIDQASEAKPVKPTHVALNNREIEIARENWNAMKLPEPEQEKQAEVFNQVKIEGSDGYKLAKALLSDPRPISTKEHAALVISLAQAEREYFEHSEEAVRQDQAGNEKAAAAQRIAADVARQKIDVITTAARGTGTLAGRALAIRRARIELDSYKYAGVMQRAKTVAGKEAIKPEDEAALKEAAKKIEALQAEIDKLTEELSRAREADSKEKSKEFVEEAVKRRTVRDRTTAQKRRTDYVRRLKELGHQVADTYNSANPLNMTSEEISLLVKIAKTYVDEGTSTLAGIVGRIQSDIPDLSQNDIYNALGGRIKSAEKKIVEEVDRKISELKKQARLWAKIHDALEGKFDKATKGSVSEKVAQLTEIFDELRQNALDLDLPDKQLKVVLEKIDEAQKQLDGGFRNIPDAKKGGATTPELESARETLRELQQMMRTEDAIADLEEQKRTGEYKVSSREQRIIKNAKLERLLAQRIALRREIDQRIAKLATPTWQKWVVETWATPRAMMSMLDASFVLKQGAWFMVTHPIKSSKGLYPALRAAFDEGKHDEFEAALENHPNRQQWQMMGLAFTEIDAKASKREEHFLNNLAERVPGVRSLVRGSNRSMITFLNLQRAAMANVMLEANKEWTPEQLRMLGSYINWGTGRGGGGGAERLIPMLNQFFYAPRYTMSRWQLLSSPFLNWKNPEVRSVILKDFAKFFAFHMVVMAIAHSAGLEVGVDPDEWTFGRIKVGKTWYDLLGGLQQPVRFVALILKSGISAVEGEKAKKSAVSLLMAFTQYKLNPSITTTSNVLAGTDTFGREEPRWKLAAQGFTPIVGGDLYNIVTNSETPEEAALASFSSFFGGSVTIPKKRSSGSGNKQSPD